MGVDRDGDDEKKPQVCKENVWKCPNLKEKGGGFEGEQYVCEVCGERIWLDYEDMK